MGVVPLPAVVLVGAQWGDEGKGKVVDFLAAKADAVVRSQGGNNAGHTLRVGETVYKLHLVPSGILYPGTLCIIGHGVALDPLVLQRELEQLRAGGISVDSLRISPAAHLIMPWHIRLDELQEDQRGAGKIGTTRRGVGPCYVDKYARTGIRFGDLLDADEFRARLAVVLAEKNALFERVYGAAPMTAEEVAEPYLRCAEELRPFAGDTVELLHEALEQGQNVLFEGAQGNLLDIDFGTYPYVTSSHPVAGGACVGAGVGPTEIDRVLGVVKAYISRVGDGPFPTELHDATGEWIRERGQEYGTTTGRPRRIGWLDLPMLRYAARVSGFTDLAVTRLDTLSGLERLQVCVAYRRGGEQSRTFPPGLKALGEVEPVYTEVEGWSGDLSGARRLADLPAAARRYLELITEHTGVPVSLVSVGARRDETMELRPLFGARSGSN